MILGLLMLLSAENLHISGSESAHRVRAVLVVLICLDRLRN